MAKYPISVAAALFVHNRLKNYMNLIEDLIQKKLLAGVL